MPNETLINLENMRIHQEILIQRPCSSSPMQPYVITKTPLCVRMNLELI